MAKRADQKEKLLYVLKFLMENSDEENHVSSESIIDYLAEHDIIAERKSIYSDIKALQHFGIDIISSREGAPGYYVASRDFDLSELKLLVDSIQSSKFITKQTTSALIKKISALGSKGDAKKLQRQVFVRNRVKTMNESVLNMVDHISDAISRKCPIQFKYYDFTPKKEHILRHNEKVYEVSPYTFILDDENYYLICFDHEAQQIRHYRVDRMTQVRVQRSKSCLGEAEYKKLDMSSYTQAVFGMFNGRRVNVTMRFADYLAGSVIDRYGTDAMLIPDGEGHFTVTAEVAVSPRYFGWLLGFGTGAEIVHPAEVRDEMKKFVEEIAEIYKQN